MVWNDNKNPLSFILECIGEREIVWDLILPWQGLSSEALVNP